MVTSRFLAFCAIALIATGPAVAGEKGVARGSFTGLEIHSRSQVCDSALAVAQGNIPSAAATFGRAAIIGQKCDCGQDQIYGKVVWSCEAFITWETKE